MRKLIVLISISILICSCTKDQKISETEKKEIISELNEIKILDQKYAGIPPADLFEKYGNKRAWEIFEGQRDSVEVLNQQKIEDLYKQYGYLGQKKIGEEASSDFWLPIQHADNDVAFQQKMLEAMKKEIENGSDDKYRFAMLEDRINVNLNKPKRFGSQLTYNKYGQAIPKIGLVDSLNIERLRKEFSLQSFKEYCNEMTIAHFEMNKQMFLDKGITEPKLYK